MKPDWQSDCEICIAGYIQAGVHPKGRWAATTDRDRGTGRQDCPRGRGDHPQSDLRRGFSGILLRIPSRAKPTRCVGCADGGNRAKASELGAGCGYSGVLRQPGPRMAAEVYPAPCGRPEDAAADPEMVEGPRIGGRQLVGDEGWHTARGRDFTPVSQYLF